jgi:hypothetical protein
MKTKIITAYWMDAEGYPFQSTRTSLKTRYQGSLISHCKGIDYPIICYTHKRNEQELLDLKENNNLTNLEIKLLELSDMKYHKQISEIRDVNFDTDLSGRGPEIMWGKFQALEQELDDCDRIYWIDCGLQHPGIFPWMYCVPYGDKKYHIGVTRPVWADKEITQYDFTNLLNTKIFDKLNKICDGKVASLTSNGPQIGYGFYQENNILDYGFLGPYPIGGLIGGDTNSMKSYLKSFWETCEKVMDKKVLCTEEAIMKVAHDENKDIMIPFTFDVYATNEHDHYHFELWEPSCNKPKPLYMVWHDILNYE